MRACGLRLSLDKHLCSLHGYLMFTNNTDFQRSVLFADRVVIFGLFRMISQCMRCIFQFKKDMEEKIYAWNFLARIAHRYQTRKRKRESLHLVRTKTRNIFTLRMIEQARYRSTRTCICIYVREPSLRIPWFFVPEVDENTGSREP